jgi:hypothetical protein
MMGMVEQDIEQEGEKSEEEGRRGRRVVGVVNLSQIISISPFLFFSIHVCSVPFFFGVF